MVIKSYAKVNLYLEVINKRKDGYHSIKTLFQRIDLHDTIILTSLPGTQIKILSDSRQLPLDSSNLAYRSAQILQEGCKVKRGVQIALYKRIPIGSGLAGGSSNAAAVLMGLNKLWKLNLSREKLVRFATIIGSDVAFFVHATPFAIGEGKGERIESVKSLKRVRWWYVLVVPKLHVSTPDIYQKWDSFSSLTRPDFDVKLLILALKRKNASRLGSFLFNSLEPVTSALYPQIKRVRSSLRNQGVHALLMSGSGPAVFGIVSSRKEAVRISRQLASCHKNWQVFAAATI